jgi:hypothetical protein
MYIVGYTKVVAEMVMEITVAEISAHNLQDANKCHEPFTVDSALVLSAENGFIRHSVVSVSPYEKRYPPNEVDYTAYINNPDQTVFFGYSAEKLAGELVIRRWWNNFAYIEDITVKTTFKRQGVENCPDSQRLGIWNSTPITTSFNCAFMARIWKRKAIVKKLANSFFRPGMKQPMTSRNISRLITWRDSKRMSPPN